MTDYFLHPDGHHYRFSRLGKVCQVGEYGLLDSKMVEGLTHDFDTFAIFERVEPPLWPWTSPGAVIYTLTDEGFLDADMDLIPPEDFAGLAELLAKQAALNEGDA